MKKSTLIILGALSIGLSSCKREGCTDERATNYEDRAKEDDGTCFYDADLAIYWGITLPNQLLNSLSLINENAIDVLVDGEKVGSTTLQTTHMDVFRCDYAGTIQTQISMGGSSSKAITITLIGQEDDGNGGSQDVTVFTYDTTLEPGCNLIQVDTEL